MAVVLLDYCVPRRFASALPGHIVVHVLDKGWDNLSDGNLLDVAAGQFDVIVTMDRNIQYQQVLRGRKLALIVLRGESIKLKDLLSLVPA